MVRGKWKASLVTAAAWAGMALGQQTAPPPGKPAAAKTLMVQEAGKPAQPCRVLRAWKQPDGASAFEVEAIANGARMTIVSSGSSGGAGQPRFMTTRIYHWVQLDAPPPGTPTPPADAAVQNVTGPVSAPAAPLPVASIPKPMPQPVAMAPQPVTVPKPMPQPVAMAPQPVTMMPARQTMPQPVNVMAAPKVAPQPVRVAETPRPVAQPVMTAPTPAPMPAPVAVQQTRPIPLPRPAVTPVVAKAVEKPRVEIETAQPTDWHQSWGKADDHRSRTPPKPEPLPSADTTKEDPLKEPEAYRKGDLDAALNMPEPTKSRWFGGSDLGIQRVSAESPAEPVQAASADATPASAAPPVPEAPKFRESLKRVFSLEEEADANSKDLRTLVTRPAAVEPRGMPPAPTMAMPPEQAPAPSRPRRLLPIGRSAPSAEQDDSQNAFTTAAPPQDAAPTADAQAANAFSQPRPQTPPGMYPAMMADPRMAPPPMHPAMMADPRLAPPAMHPAMAAAMRGPMPQGRAPAGVKQVAMPVLAVPGMGAMPSGDTQEMMLVMRNSLYPSHREWAADKLSTVDWQSNPMVVESLMQVAREDPAASVRAACVRSLGKMNLQSLTVLENLQSLKNDKDPLVRQEVDTALIKLGGVMPASARTVAPSGRK